MEYTDGNTVVIDERTLTSRISERDVQRTLDEFETLTKGGLNDLNGSEGLNGLNGSDDEVQLIIATTDDTEARARVLLDLGEAALARVFGKETRFDVSVITAQERTTARVRVSRSAVMRFAARVGILGGSKRKWDSAEMVRTVRTAETAVSSRLSTEYQLLLHFFGQTSLLVDPKLEINFGERRLTVARARRFR